MKNSDVPYGNFTDYVDAWCWEVHFKQQTHSTDLPPNEPVAELQPK